MPNKLNQSINPSGAEKNFQPQLPKKLGLPTWASVLVIVLVAVIAIGIVSWAAYRAFSPLPITPIACTEEAKVCPDGTTVGRIPPKCEFAPCSSTQTPPDETANWKTYKLDFIEIKYPLDFFADGFPDKGLGTSLEITNFQWNKDAYSFPYVKYPPQDKFYMEIKSIDNSDNLSIKDWLDKQKDDYGVPEEVQIINEYKQIGGTLVSEKSITIDNKPALQRIIRYKGNAGNVDIIFSYVNYKSQAYQFVGHSTTDNNLKVYNQILSTFKFIEADETANWQTYRNEKYGYEIKYPQDWAYQTNLGIVHGDSENGTVLKKDSNNSVAILIRAKNTAQKYPIVSPGQCERRIVFGTAAFNAHECFYKDAVIQEGWYKVTLEYETNKYYVFYGGHYTNENTGVPIFEKILSTFKFIE